MTCLNHDYHRYTQIHYLLLKIKNSTRFANKYIVSLLKNMANESKAFRSLFKITYFYRIQNILH
jgi:hypothetical protein